jgi:peptide/nickel transport system substrate-binding protein
MKTWAGPYLPPLAKGRWASRQHTENGVIEQTMQGGDIAMKRRTFLKGSAAVVGTAAIAGAPSIAQSQASRVIKFVPEADVVVFDPIVTQSAQTREHAYLIYDMLYGLDDNYNPHPQMVEGHRVENNGLEWRLTLRDGLKWHDGERVLARDCAASVSRWAARDSFGQALKAAANEITHDGDKTIVFKLKRPFPLLPDALAKPLAYCCPMMPERIANTDPLKPITEIVGSGPYKYVANERVPGSRLVYERNTDYVPRNGGVLETTSGPKRPTFDRVEWSIIQDPATASAALERGEIDWLQTPNPDLLPRLRQNRNVVIKVISPLGLMPYMRFNHMQPPFDNPAIRRALIGGVEQSDYMIGVNGADRSLWKAPVGFFVPGSPMESKVGMEALTTKRDYSKVKRDLEAAGYKGEKVSMMVAVDITYIKIMSDVTADWFKQVGINLDYQSVDWTTIVQRRPKMDPPSAGGWNMYCIMDNGVNQLNPAGHLLMRGNGKDAAPGWPTSPRIEALRDEWFLATSVEQQKKLGDQIQAQCFQDVPYIPLGQCFAPTGYRSNITGVLNGQPTFWNVRRT